MSSAAPVALQARRFHGKPLLRHAYNFCDVPYCGRDLAGSTVSVITERQHLVDSIAELTLVCNEAVRRKGAAAGGGGAAAGSAGGAAKSTKPLSIEYIFDRIDTDDPIWGLVVRTDAPASRNGRPSNAKACPLWKRGMLQGFVTMTTFTNWQASFRFDSLAEVAFGQDDDELADQRRRGLRTYDEDGSLAEDLEASVKGGNPHVEGIVYPRIAEVSLFGGLGCGKQLLKLLVEHLEHLKATAQFNYDHLVLQATENSIPFYEAMGFIRVGCVQGRAPSPDAYVSSPVEEYHTRKNGETPLSVAKEFGVEAWDVVFLNKPFWPDLLQKSWLKMGTKLLVPRSTAATDGAPRLSKWYISQNNDSPRSIAKKIHVDLGGLLQANRVRYPDMVGNSKLIEGTRIQISRFEMDEGNTVAYSHWTFPDADLDDEDAASYMMALKLKPREKGWRREAARPVADALAVPIRPYSPEATGAKALLLQPKAAPPPLAPIFAAKQPAAPKKPKRPVCSYAHFTAACRSSMAGELEGKAMGEVSRILSDKWRAMSDAEKRPYQERWKKSKAAHGVATARYRADVARFRRESPAEAADAGGAVQASLLEQVVKLKSTDGISGASKFEYYYVLTFIPDLAWVHLIPMRKAGVFGPEYPDARGRPVWMIVGEDEGKEIDTTAAVCQPVTALTIKNSADADDEQWDIYDNGQKPRSRTPAPPVAVEAKANVSAAPENELNIPVPPKNPKQPLPVPPKKPKKPASSFAFFLGDAMKELANEPRMQITGRTKIISERWSAMTDEEKQKYKDKTTTARGEYNTAMSAYKEDLATFYRENPGIPIPQIPKSVKKKQTPGKVAGEGKQTLGKGAGEGCKEKEQSQSNPGATDGTPVPKRKKVQPPKDPPLHASMSKAVVHTVKKDPVELEKLLGTLTGDSQTYETPGKDDIILSLMDDSYKVIMWRHFNMLGSTRDGKRENKICDEVLMLLKQKIGSVGKFLKGSPDKYYQVDDVAAREKIINDIRRRITTAKNWLQGEESQNSLASTKPPPLPVCSVKTKSPKTKREPPPLPVCPAKTKSPKTKRLEPGDTDVVLSYLNEKYKNIMWSHFRKLGRAHGEDVEVGKKIFHTLKKGLGKGGVFFKKPSFTNNLLQINDDDALEKITRDLRRRLETCDRWLTNEREEAPSVEKKPRVSPACKPRQLRQQPTSKAVAETAPQLSSRYPRRGSQPAPPSPSKDSEEIPLDQEKPRPSPTHKAQHSRQDRTSKAVPERKPHLSSSRYPRRGSQPEPTISTDPMPQRPLAPIFLQSYGKKKKQSVSEEVPPAGSKQNEEAPRRYPARKRKQITDDSHVVSDDATSSDVMEPRKKKVKTNQ